MVKKDFLLSNYNVTLYQGPPTGLPVCPPFCSCVASVGTRTSLVTLWCPSVSSKCHHISRGGPPFLPSQVWSFHFLSSVPWFCSSLHRRSIHDKDFTCSRFRVRSMTSRQQAIHAWEVPLSHKQDVLADEFFCVCWRMLTFMSVPDSDRRLKSLS